MTEPVPGRYRHFKGGEYEVIGVARHSERASGWSSTARCTSDSGLWVCPVAMFTETVLVDGKTVPRFAPISSDRATSGQENAP